MIQWHRTGKNWHFLFNGIKYHSFTAVEEKNHILHNPRTTPHAYTVHAHAPVHAHAKHSIFYV
jgi:hypothetical protein